MQVTKRDGKTEPFNPNKARQWVMWSVEGLKDRIKMEYEILEETFNRLPSSVSTEEIHQTMINVCLDKEQIEYSRVAAKLELASIYKAQEKILGLYKPHHASFTDIIEIMESKGLWRGAWLDNEDLIEKEDLVNEWFIELEAHSLEFCTIKQWSDKYSIKLKHEAIETPAAGCLAIALAYHGVTELAFGVAKDLITYKLNLPTPALNGCRNGDFNSISCCIIEAGDTVESIDTAEAIASAMTAKKAGIGITLDTRSKGDPVKNGAVTHLGKHPLYKSIESSVKKYTQLTRGGSATMTFKAIDPDIMEILLWKTQRIDLSQRVDKMDYSFAYNDFFVESALNNDDWYLFSKYWAPQVHDNFHSPHYEEYVKEALRNNTPHTKVKALDVLKEFLTSRWETGRLYCINVTRTNEHTPFLDTIVQSNLCLEIALPTKPYVDLDDYRADYSKGETAFCTLAALNVANIPIEEYFQVAERALRTVDKMIEMAPCLTQGLKNSLLARRSVGIGITGLASLIYKNGLDYDGSKESLDFVEEAAELHYYALLRASQQMSMETGIKVQGIKKDWLPIDTKKGNKDPVFDWEALRGKPRMHSVLVANMPTESSAVFSNATNGVYPSRNRVIYKKARKGKVQFISQHFTPDKLSAWDTNMVPYYGGIQNYADQSTSADYYTDFTKYPNKKIPMKELIRWFVTQWAAGCKTAYYQNFVDTRGEIEQEDSCEGGSCKL